MNFLITTLVIYVVLVIATFGAVRYDEKVSKKNDEFFEPQETRAEDVVFTFIALLPLAMFWSAVFNS